MFYTIASIRGWTTDWGDAAFHGILFGGWVLALCALLLLLQLLRMWRKKTDRVKQAALDRERSLFDSGPVYVFRWRLGVEPTAEYVSANVRDLGYQPDEFISGQRAFNDIVHPDDRGRVLHEAGAFTKQQDSYSHNYRIVTADGAVRWVKDVSRLIRGAFNRPSLQDFYLVDLTRQYEQEARLCWVEAQLRGLIDSPEEARALFDRDMRLIHSSPLFKTLWVKDFGEPPEPGLPVDVFLREQGGDAVWQAYRQALEGKPSQREIKRQLNGQERNLRLICRPLFADDLVIGFAEESIDVTAQRISEASLDFVRSHFNGLTENASDCLATYDSRGRLAFFNTAYADLYRVRHDLVLKPGMNVGICLQKNDQSWWAALHERALHGEEVRQVLEYREDRGMGTKRFVEASFVPLKHGDRTIGYAEYSCDITTQRALEDDIRNSRDMFDALLNAPTSAVMMAQLDGSLVAVNDIAARMLGAKVGDLVGASLYNLLPPPVATARRERVERVIHSGEALRFEDEWEGRIYDNNFYPVFDEHGRVSRLAVYSRDITERKKVEREQEQLQLQIRQSQKLESLGMLAGGVAHDFNNLLCTVLGNVDLARLCLPEASTVCPHLEEIEVAAKRATDLCAQMLAYAGKRTLHKERVDINELVREMGELLKVSHSKKVRMKFDFQEGLPGVDADETQLRQVVMNLITNAAQAIGADSGEVTIRTGLRQCGESYLREGCLQVSLPAGEYVFLEVSDTGCGMDAQTQERIFDPFFTTKETGRGLGLAAVLGIIHGHRGTLKLETAPGEGSVFTVLLPPAHGPARPVDTTPSVGKGWRGKGVVLLVDDEEDVRRAARKMLEHLGFRVMEAANGCEAVSVFETHADTLHCVVLDRMMPYMNGEEAIREIRKLRSDIPIVLCSGYSKKSMAPGELPGTVFLKKPYQLQEMANAISYVLSVMAAPEG